MGTVSIGAVPDEGVWRPVITVKAGEVDSSDGVREVSFYADAVLETESEAARFADFIFNALAQAAVPGNKIIFQGSAEKETFGH